MCRCTREPTRTNRGLVDSFACEPSSFVSRNFAPPDEYEVHPHHSNDIGVQVELSFSDRRACTTTGGNRFYFCLKTNPQSLQFRMKPYGVTSWCVSIDPHAGQLVALIVVPIRSVFLTLTGEHEPPTFG